MADAGEGANPPTLRVQRAVMAAIVAARCLRSDHRQSLG